MINRVEIKLKVAIIILILGFFQLNGFSQNDTLKQISDTINGIYIPVDLDDCFEQINTFCNDTTIEKMCLMNESEFLGKTYIGFGMWIRNNWGLWGGSRLSIYFNDMGIYHPDDMSGIILTSYYRNITNKAIKLKQQVRKTKKYWRKSNIKLKKREKEVLKELKTIFKSINIGDTLEFSYDYDFISKEQEVKWMDDLCLAKGNVLDKNRKEFLLQIKLIESCDESGIVIFKGDIYKKDKDKWILVEKDKIEIMKQGEIKWLMSKSWYPLDY